MSRAVKQADRGAAHGHLLAAAEKYAASLRWNPNNPQVGGAQQGACQAARHAGVLFWGDAPAHGCRVGAVSVRP